MDGSSVLVQALAQNDLVDEYSLHVYPLVFGGGKRLFPQGVRFNLTLVEASPLPYRRGVPALPARRLELTLQPRQLPVDRRQAGRLGSAGFGKMPPAKESTVQRQGIPIIMQ